MDLHIDEACEAIVSLFRSTAKRLLNGLSLGFLSVTERQVEARRRLGKRVSLLDRRPPLETRAEAVREHLKM